VQWSRNQVGGEIQGTDDTWSFDESCAVAETRMRYGGIPGTASIINAQTGICVRE
jgi:hypothetical protein